MCFVKLSSQSIADVWQFHDLSCKNVSDKAWDVEGNYLRQFFLVIFGNCNSDLFPNFNHFGGKIAWCLSTVLFLMHWMTGRFEKLPACATVMRSTCDPRLMSTCQKCLSVRVCLLLPANKCLLLSACILLLANKCLSVRVCVLLPANKCLLLSASIFSSLPLLQKRCWGPDRSESGQTGWSWSWSSTPPSSSSPSSPTPRGRSPTRGRRRRSPCPTSTSRGIHLDCSLQTKKTLTVYFSAFRRVSSLYTFSPSLETGYKAPMYINCTPSMASRSPKSLCSMWRDLLRVLFSGLVLGPLLIYGADGRWWGLC